jgi:hypothetical protein
MEEHMEQSEIDIVNNICDLESSIKKARHILNEVDRKFSKSYFDRNEAILDIQNNGYDAKTGSGKTAVDIIFDFHRIALNLDIVDDYLIQALENIERNNTRDNS